MSTQNELNIKWNEDELEQKMLVEKNNHHNMVHPVQYIYEKYENKKLNFDIPVQRREVWTNAQRANLILSILHGDAIDNILLEQDSENPAILHGLDGQNRTKALVRFIKGEYAFPKIGVYNTSIYGIDLSGLYFKDFPEVFQKAILQYQLNCTIYQSLTNEHRERVFFMKQQGSPLSTVENLRAVIGVEGIEGIEDIINHEFIKALPLSISDYKKQNDFNIAVTCMLIEINDGETGVDKKDMIEFTQRLRAEGIDEHTKSKIFKTFEDFRRIIESAKVTNEKFAKMIIKPTHVTGIYNLLRVIRKNNYNVAIEDLIREIEKFFVKIQGVKKLGDDYTPKTFEEKKVYSYIKASRSSTRKCTNVTQRNQDISDFVLCNLGVRDKEVQTELGEGGVE